jgi:hypothetical protein
MALEGLTAEVVADATDYIATMDRVIEKTDALQDEATNVSLAMAVLEGRMDEVSQESRELAASSLLASRSLSGLSASSGRASFSLTGLSTSLTGSVIPGLLGGTAAAAALSAAVVSVGGAVASLAGTFGLLLGAGIVTQMEKLKQSFEDVIPRIKEALRPLGRVFGPLLQEAIQSLPQLTRNIVQAIGGVSEFRGALAQLGRQLFEVIPSLVGGMVEFARVALPAMREFLSIIGDGSGFAFIQRIFQRISDDVTRLVSATARLIPPFLKLGGVLVELLAPAATSLINILGKSAKILAVLANALRPLFPLITGVSRLFGSVFGKVLDGVLHGLTAMVALLRGDIPAAMKNFRKVMTESAIPIGELFLKALAGLGQAVINLGQWAAEGMTNAIIGAINNRIIPAINSLVARFNAQTPFQAGLVEKIPKADFTSEVGQARMRRSQARRGNPSAREGLPPIEVRGDTGVVEDVAFAAGEEGGQRAVRGATRRKRRQRQRSDRR